MNGAVNDMTDMANSSSNQTTSKPADDRVFIFDTTLRDGEQSPGASMNNDEKVRIATTLDEMGVDIIEAGFPVASPGDFEAVKKISSIVRHARVAGLSRAAEADIRRAAQAVEGAVKPRIHTFIATSPLHMKHKLKMGENAVLDAIGASVSLACSLIDDVEWSAEDATRSEPEFLCKAIELAIASGARTINLPDTVGYTEPEEYAEMIRMVKARVRNIDEAVISVHCHNDLGLGVANSLAAIKAGARQVECTINGIGERAGNAALEEVVMALRTRPDRLPFVTNIDTTRITQASRLVSAVTGFAVQPNKAIVGKNAFAHESGIHQDGVLKNAQTYEIMTPASVGLNTSSLTLGKLSGRHAFREKLRSLGYELPDDMLKEAFERFKDLADRKREIFDDDLIALVDDELGTEGDRIRFVSLQVIAGSKGPQQATLELEVDGEIQAETVTGNGPVDATFKAVRALFPNQARLKLYQVHAVTEGTDAQARVTVRLEEEGRTVNGQGADTDTLVASARAYVHAMNKLFDKRMKIAPEEQVAV